MIFLSKPLSVVDYWSNSRLSFHHVNKIQTCAKDWCMAVQFTCPVNRQTTEILHNNKYGGSTAPCRVGFVRGYYFQLK